MKEERKTKKQLIGELLDLRKKVSELEALEAGQTGRKTVAKARAEEPSEDCRQRVLSLFENLPQPVIIYDEKNVILHINEVGARRFEWNVSDLTGKKLSKLLPKKPGEPYQDTLKATYAEGAIHSERTFATRTGRPIMAEVHECRIMFEGHLGILCLVNDITERKRMEEERIKFSRLESIAELSSGIAHDFNNYLTTILGNISLAFYHVDKETALYRILDKAEKACLLARNLTRQLLTFAREGTPVKTATPIVGLIKNSAGLSLRGSNVECNLSVSGSLWPVKVDVGQIGQAVGNLVLNAAQSTPKGGMIEVRAENTVLGQWDAPPLKKGKYVKISIEDHGPGIEKENLQKIFDPYFNGIPEGSGLRLSTAYSIVNKNGGLLTVDSEPGVGTTFSIFLAAAAEAEVPEKKEEEGEVFSFKGKILVMDDEQLVRDTAVLILSHFGHKVEVAKNGEEALELYRKASEAGEPFDAVILDLTVHGGMGGEETVKRLLETAPGARVIISSGYICDPVLANYRQYGFRGLVSKPYKIVELSRELNRVVQS